MQKLTEFLWKFFHIVSGRTLVLFTAFFSIREVYSSLKIELERDKIHLLAQWISGSKHKQIEFFKANPSNSIMLWTDTFWEGIDIPGQDLQYLIIHKIPFAVPSDPIFMARSKLYKDSFAEYAIPKSILKLKQWFWRLIRTKKDTGIVVFLDDRIYTTKWWERFLSSFPSDIKIRYTTSDKLLDLLSQNK
jgi:Rad3-related DNA helicase